jgi:hypothetical protein
VGDESSKDYAYVMEGTLRRTPLEQTTTSFGLGFVGVLLWLLPIPMSKTSAGIDLDLELLDVRSGELVWARTLRSEISRLITLYTSSAMIYGRSAFSFNLVPPPSDARVDHRSLFSWHFEALRRGMVESRADLARALKRLPAFSGG